MIMFENLDNKLNFPSLKPPTIEEAKKFNLDLFINKGTKNETFLEKPTYISDDTVWAMAHRNDIAQPYYCLYDCGTNYLRIVKNYNGFWSNIEPNEIDNLYGFIWKMLVALEGYRNKSSKE